MCNKDKIFFVVQVTQYPKVSQWTIWMATRGLGFDARLQTIPLLRQHPLKMRSLRRTCRSLHFIMLQVRFQFRFRIISNMVIKTSFHFEVSSSGPPGKGALLYSSGWPELRRVNGTTIILSTPVGEPTIKPTRLYTMLVVRFVDGDSRDKVRNSLGRIVLNLDVKH